jgi:hypothetical protein
MASLWKLSKLGKGPTDMCSLFFQKTIPHPGNSFFLSSRTNSRLFTSCLPFLSFSFHPYTNDVPFHFFLILYRISHPPFSFTFPSYFPLKWYTYYQFHFSLSLSPLHFSSICPWFSLFLYSIFEPLDSISLTFQLFLAKRPCFQSCRYLSP